MLRFLTWTFLAIHLATAGVAKDFATMFPELSDIDPDLKAELERLDYKQGKITVGNGIATFDVGDSFYFLDPADANTVLVDFWENPAGAPPLGMLFPTGMTPFHNDAWGIIIMFDEIGYVSDEDANEYDYDEVLSTMRSDLAEENKQRVASGYPSITLVGWAEKPRYDQSSRKLYWAKELAFSDTELNTLNYNIRALGRKGVLVMNFVAPIEALDEIKANVPTVLAMSNFTDGNKYSDFNPSLDKVATFGIGGLIAGKVIAKTGIFLGLLLMFKKFFFLLLLPIAWGWNKLTGKSKNDST